MEECNGVVLPGADAAGVPEAPNVASVSDLPALVLTSWAL